jgi:hypothetical protein
MLAKTGNYFCDGEAVKTPSQGATPREFGRKDASAYGREELTGNMAEGALWVDNGGANLRDVWSISHEPLRAAHYAAYPSELVYRCLAAGTSQEGYCDACGAPFARVVETKPTGDGTAVARAVNGQADRHFWGGAGWAENAGTTQTLGWRPSCRCPDAKPRPGRVLDPFCGSGRTAVVARRMQLDFVGCELNETYAAMARKIVKDDAPLFNDFGD